MEAKRHSSAAHGQRPLPGQPDACGTPGRRSVPPPAGQPSLGAPGCHLSRTGERRTSRLEGLWSPHLHTNLREIVAAACRILVTLALLRLQGPHVQCFSPPQGYCSSSAHVAHLFSSLFVLQSWQISSRLSALRSRCVGLRAARTDRSEREALLTAQDRGFSFLPAFPGRCTVTTRFCSFACFFSLSMKFM